MQSSASFVGVGIQGITVPLRDGMPTLTNNNFVVGDLNQLTGLKGDASTKYISTGALDTATAQNDYSMSTWVTDNVVLDNAYWMGSPRIAHRSGGVGNFVRFSTNNNSSSAISVSPDSVINFIGQTRTVGTEFDYLVNTTSGTALKDSLAPLGAAISVFGYSAGSNLNASRIATYHYGPALNLATLEGLQATLLAEIAGVGFSTEAANYFGRLVNAGDTTFLAYRQPLANYIDSLVALGGAYWDDMVSAASFVGVGIQGITVPLRNGMTVPTNNNFVAGDLDQLTGLKGDGSTKYIDTGVNAATNLSQNDASISVYPTSDRDVGVTSLYIASSAGNFAVVNNPTGFRSRHFNSTLSTNGTSTSVGGLIGISRDNASDYDWYDVGATGTNAEVSVSQSNTTIGVFATGVGSLINSSRLATYHAGPALNLATLEGLQDTLITEIAAI
jgi:hypothetical protein